MNLPDDPKLLQAKAWIGDAVLALCIREWLLHQDGRVSSAFAFGQPTAEVGQETPYNVIFRKIK